MRTVTRRRAFGTVLTVFGMVLVLGLSGCQHTPAEFHAHCQRWAQNFTRFGEHRNLEAYREDLIVTCMAQNQVPYTTPPQTRSRIAADTEWFNTSVPEDEYTKALGRDKAGCIERGYVGQASRGESSGKVAGFGTAYGSSVGGKQSGSYSSQPVFNDELFVACMNAAGWGYDDFDPEQNSQ